MASHFSLWCVMPEETQPFFLKSSRTKWRKIQPRDQSTATKPFLLGLRAPEGKITKVFLFSILQHLWKSDSMGSTHSFRPGPNFPHRVMLELQREQGNAQCFNVRCLGLRLLPFIPPGRKPTFLNSPKPLFPNPHKGRRWKRRPAALNLWFLTEKFLCCLFKELWDTLAEFNQISQSILQVLRRRTNGERRHW